MSDLTMEGLQSAFAAALQQNNSIAAKANAKALNSKSGGSSGSSGGSGSTWRDPDMKGLTGAASAFTGSIKGLHSGFGGMITTVQSSTKSFTEFSKGISSSSNGVKLLGEGLLAGSIMIGASLVKWVGDSMDTYRSLNSIGQTFGGSVLNMQLAAAQARMPLGEFSAALTKNSQLVSVIGAQGFGNLSKSLRSSLVDVGQLGLSLSDTNDIVAAYSQNMLTLGQKQVLSSRDATAGMRDLAVESSMLAAQSGKNRMELIKEASQALADPSLVTKAMTMQGAAGEQFAAATQKSIMFMTSLPGEAGKLFSTMSSQAYGAGTSLFSAGAQMFTKAGMGGMVGIMDEYTQRVKNGDDSDASRAQMVNKALSLYTANAESLNRQVIAGNPDAVAAVAALNELKKSADNYSVAGAARIRAEQAQQTKTTNALNNLNYAFDNVTGTIKEQLIKGLIAFTDQGGAEYTKTVNDLVAQVKIMIAQVFSPENISAMMTFAVNVGKVLVPVVQGLGFVLTNLMKGFNFLVDKVGVFGAVVGTVITLFLVNRAKLAIQKELKASKDRMMGKEIEQGAEQGVSHALVKFSNGSALRVVDINHPAAQNAAAEAAGEIEESKGTSGKGGKFSKVSKFASKAGRYAGPALALADMATNATMDDKNPAKKTVTGALGGAATGAFVGEMAEPLLAMLAPLTGGLSLLLAPFAPLIGGAIGGAIGALMANWDDVKDAFSKGFTAIADTFSGLFNWLGKIVMYTPIGGVINLVKLFTTSGWDKGFETLKTSISGAFDMFANVFSNVFGWLGDKISWLANLDIMGLLKKYLPSSVVDMIDVLAGKKSITISGPADKASESGKTEVKIEQMQNTIATLQKQLAETQKDNATIHKQLDKLINAVSHGSNQSAALNGAILDATKKGNKIMSDPLSGPA